MWPAASRHRCATTAAPAPRYRPPAAARPHAMRAVRPGRSGWHAPPATARHGHRWRLASAATGAARVPRVGCGGDPGTASSR
ncbi:hypothetical protein G6F23_014616 [Rhizopus arrhizus]|nr:hypothetical protein G6F23_014616 [Rhizopus arrhizus]